MRLLVVVAMLAASPVLAGDRPPVGATATLDRPVAIVNRAPIWQSQLDVQTALLAVGDKAGPDAAKRGLEELIDSTLIIQHAGVAPSSEDEIKQALEQIKAQNNIDDAGLDKLLAAQHLTRGQYRVELARQIQLQRAMARDLAPLVQIRDEDVQRAYDEKKAENPAFPKLDDAMKDQLRQWLYASKLDAARGEWVAKLRKTAHIERKL